jgi:hypothetical protein
MLKLTGYGASPMKRDVPVYIVVSKVSYVTENYDGQTLIVMGETNAVVQESAEDVVRMIEEATKPAVPPVKWGDGERADTLLQLREVCGDFGDNDWPNELHLGDVIDKHLARHLHAMEPAT